MKKARMAIVSSLDDMLRNLGQIGTRRRAMASELEIGPASVQISTNEAS